MPKAMDTRDGAVCFITKNRDSLLLPYIKTWNFVTCDNYKCFLMLAQVACRILAPPLPAEFRVASLNSLAALETPFAARKSYKSSLSRFNYYLHPFFSAQSGL